MGAIAAEEESYHLMPQQMEQPEPSTLSSINAMLEQVRELADKTWEAMNRPSQAQREWNMELSSTPPSDETQVASTQESVEEEQLVDIDTEPRETSLEVDILMPPSLEIIRDSPIKEPSPEPIYVVPEPEIDTFCNLEGCGDYNDPWEHYFSKPPAELCWWFYLSSAGSHAQAIEDLKTFFNVDPVGFKAIKCDA